MTDIHGYPFCTVSQLNKRAFRRAAIVTPSRCFEFFEWDRKMEFVITNWDKEEQTHVYHRLELGEVGGVYHYHIWTLKAQTSKLMHLVSFKTIKAAKTHLASLYSA